MGRAVFLTMQGRERPRVGEGTITFSRSLMLETRKIVQWVKYLPCKPKDLSSDS